MEEFIGWLGGQGVRQSEVMTLSMDLYIKWLVVRACEEEGEEPEIEMPQIPASTQPRCLGCGQWMPRKIAVPLHPSCARLYFQRQAA